MISVSFKGRKKSEAAIPALSSRIYFYTEKLIRILTKEGLDAILDYETLTLKSCTAVDNFDTRNFKHPHFYLEKYSIPTNATLRRLMRKSRMIKLVRAHIRKFET